MGSNDCNVLEVGLWEFCGGGGDVVGCEGLRVFFLVFGLGRLFFGVFLCIFVGLVGLVVWGGDGGGGWSWECWWLGF